MIVFFLRNSEKKERKIGERHCTKNMGMSENTNELNFNGTIRKRGHYIKFIYKGNELRKN